MLDLANLPTTAAARVARCVPRRDAGGAIVWDVDVVVDIRSDDDASTVDAFVPGTVKQYTAGRTFASNGSAKVAGGFDVVRVSFDKLSGDSLAAGHADVRQCAANVKGDSAVLVVKLRVHGLLPHAAASLAYALDECVDVRLDSQRAARSTTQQKRVETSDDELLGRVVVVGEHAGVVVECSVDALVLDTIVERVELARPKRVDTLLDVQFDADTIGAFERACVGSGLIPSWHALIESIGRLYARGEIEPTGDCAWVLDEHVVDEAVDALEASTTFAEA